MIIISDRSYGVCSNVGELVDALSQLDRDLPLEIGCDEEVEVKLMSGAPQEGEVCAYTQWVELDII